MEDWSYTEVPLIESDVIPDSRKKAYSRAMKEYEDKIRCQAMWLWLLEH